MTTTNLTPALEAECNRQDAENAGEFAATSSTISATDLIAIHSAMRDRPGFLEAFQRGMSG